MQKIRFLNPPLFCTIRRDNVEFFYLFFEYQNLCSSSPFNFSEAPSNQGLGIGWHYFLNSVKNSVRMMLMRMEVAMGK